MATNASSPAGCFVGASNLIARAILFIGCVGMAIGWLSFILSANKTDELGNTFTITLVDYATAGLMLATCLIGIHAELTRNPKGLKIFVLMISALALSQVVGVISQYITWDTYSANFELTFKLAQPDYQWVHHSASETNEATKWVDDIQTKLACCGLIDPYKEWASVRPETMEKDILPSTCCQFAPFSVDTTCHYQYSYNFTCLGQYNVVVLLNLIWSSLRAIMLIILALLAFTIAKPSGTLNGNAPAHNDQSVRFDGGPYVHEPTRQAPFENQKPPTYSMTNDVPLSPPPAYSMSC